jgi:hypothetical protein
MEKRLRKILEETKGEKYWAEAENCQEERFISDEPSFCNENIYGDIFVVLLLNAHNHTGNRNDAVGIINTLRPGLSAVRIPVGET